MTVAAVTACQLPGGAPPRHPSPLLRLTHSVDHLMDALTQDSPTDGSTPESAPPVTTYPRNVKENSVYIWQHLQQV